MDIARPASETPVEPGGNETVSPPEVQVATADEQQNEQEQIPDENNEQNVQEPSHQLSQSLKAISKVKLYYAHFADYF